MKTLEPWPPPGPPPVGAHNLAEAQTRLAGLEAEIVRLQAADKANRWRGGLSLVDEERLGRCRNDVATLRTQIDVATKMQRGAA